MCWRCSCRFPLRRGIDCLELDIVASQCHEGLLERCTLLSELVQHDLVRRRGLTDLCCRQACYFENARLDGDDRDTAADEQLTQPRRLRRADADEVLRSPAHELFDARVR